MDAERWKRINDLFEQALEIETSRRPAFLDSVCQDDSELRRELESLLAADRDATVVIDTTLQQAARDMYSLGAPFTTLQPGDLFSHYNILQLSGRGGMGQVYLAVDVRLQRKVALKTLARGLINDADALRRFEQEARAASALNHPNIVTIYDIGECNGTHFIVCEFVEGETVRQKLGASGQPQPLAAQAAADIAAQVASGLAAAHALGITHRDIKPENIIVREDGLVKIVDFGVAKLTEKSKALTPGLNTTSPGIIVGTLKYMSPEQARGAIVDGRSDIFGLGSVLYEMLTGHAPFQGETNSDLIAEILKSDPPPLRKVMPLAPAALDAIVTKAMQKDVGDRYPTASEFADALRRWEDSGPASSSRGLGGWLAAAAAFVILIGGAGLWYWNAETLGRGQRNSTAPASTNAPPRSLAILPLRNLKEDPSTDFLGFSLADAVITRLASVDSLVVRPSSSIDRYRKQTVNPEKAGSDLKVDTLLTGTYIREGDDLRIALQLISVKPAAILWQHTIDTKYDSLLSVQDKIASQVIDGLALRLAPGAAVTEPRSDAPAARQAYEDYLRGVDLYATNDFRTAIEMLERSAAQAPGYALTWAHLGRAYTTNASLEFGGRAQYAKAQAAYEKALRLNPALIEPRVYMANLFTDTGRVEQAWPLLQEALRKNPNYAEAHWELGYAYRFSGFLPESAAECERARQLDPGVKLHSSALNSYLYLGQYDRFLASLPSDNSAYILFYRGLGQLYLHRQTEAIASFERSYKTDPALLQAELGQAMSLALQHNRKAEGLRLMAQTEAKLGERGVADAEGLYKVAQAYAMLGDRAAAMRMLRRAVDGGFFPYPYFEADPLIAVLRGEPGFSELMQVSRSRHDRFENQIKSTF